MAQRVRIVIEAEVPDSVNREEVTKRFARALDRAGLAVGSADEERLTPHLPIKTAGPRGIGAAPPSGYETRIWEKATCWFPDYRPDHLDDLIINPRMDVEMIDRVGDAARQPE